VELGFENVVISKKMRTRSGLERSGPFFLVLR
jgi:hypothetical protein